MNIGPVHYRISETGDSENVWLEVERFYPVKKTPCGYWVRSEYCSEWLSDDAAKHQKLMRFVNNLSRKRYCYPTFDEALNSCLIRKSWHIRRLRTRLERAEAAAEFVKANPALSLDMFDSNSMLQVRGERQFFEFLL